MHLSGAILLFTYVIPPSWALDAYGAAPAGDPSADVPPFVFVAGVLARCLAFHVLVHLPSGLLGTRLAHHHGAPTTCASALAIAGVLSPASGSPARARPPPPPAASLPRGVAVEHLDANRRTRLPIPRVNPGEVRASPTVATMRRDRVPGGAEFAGGDHLCSCCPSCCS
jgi:hypothetical protein